MQTISLCDNVAIKEIKGEGIRVECNHPQVPCDASNLAMRAALLVLEFLHLPPRHLLQIEKRIPVSAGLGGGSSDAAAVIRGLLRMYDRKVPATDILALAAKLGSDVPFFLKGGLALAEGRGEQVSFLDAPKHNWFVVVAFSNQLEVSTKWAYENYHPGENQRKQDLFERVVPAFLGGQEFALQKALFNDLESVTMQRYDQVRRLQDLLLADGPAPVLMSGSGPACFGLFLDRKRAMLAGKRVQEAGFQVTLETTTRWIP